MGCGNSKNRGPKRARVLDSHKHKELTAALKAAESLEAVCAPLNDAFRSAVEATTTWLAEEDNEDLRGAADPLRAAAAIVVAAGTSAKPAAASVAAAFARIVELENRVDAAARDLGKAEKARDKAEAKVKKLKAKGADAQDAQDAENAAKEAVTAAKAVAETATKERDAGREEAFATAMEDFAEAVAKQQEFALPAFKEMAGVAAALPSKPPSGSEPATPRPKGRPSVTSVDYGTLSAAAKGWDACSKATADHSKAVRTLLSSVGVWGAAVGNTFQRRGSEVSSFGPQWTDTATQVVAKLNAAAASCSEILSAEKEVDERWRAVEDAEKHMVHEERARDRTLADELATADAKSEAKQAVEIAVAARDEAMESLRDKAKATTAFKLTEVKQLLNGVANTHATRATEVKVIFDELAAKLKADKPKKPAETSKSSKTAASAGAAADGAAAEAKPNCDAKK